MEKLVDILRDEVAIFKEARDWCEEHAKVIEDNYESGKITKEEYDENKKALSEHVDNIKLRIKDAQKRNKQLTGAK